MSEVWSSPYTPPRELEDPREGQAVLGLWDFLYEVDGDEFSVHATGQLLLREDGLLWMRTGGTSSDGRTTRCRYSIWQQPRWGMQPCASARDALSSVWSHHYYLSEPGPTPIDQRESGPYPGSAAQAVYIDNGDVDTALAFREPRPWRGSA